MEGDVMTQDSLLSQIRRVSRHTACFCLFECSRQLWQAGKDQTSNRLLMIKFESQQLLTNAEFSFLSRVQKGYLTAFGVFRRPPWKRAILQTNSPCTGPARTWLSLKPWLLRLTHFLCQKCFCGKEGLEAKTLVSFKARFKFKTKAYV